MKSAYKQSFNEIGPIQEEQENEKYDSLNDKKKQTSNYKFIAPEQEFVTSYRVINGKPVVNDTNNDMVDSVNKKDNPFPVMRQKISEIKEEINSEYDQKRKSLFK